MVLSQDKQRAITNAKNNIVDDLIERGLLDEDDVSLRESVEDMITDELYRLFK